MFTDVFIRVFPFFTLSMFKDEVSWLVRYVLADASPDRFQMPTIVAPFHLSNRDAARLSLATYSITQYYRVV